VLAAEHQLYPAALALVASGRAWVEGERVVIRGESGAAPMALVWTGSGART